MIKKEFDFEQIDLISELLFKILFPKDFDISKIDNFVFDKNLLDCPRGRSRPDQALLPSKGDLLWVYFTDLVFLMHSLVSRRMALPAWSWNVDCRWGRDL